MVSIPGNDYRDLRVLSSTISLEKLSFLEKNLQLETLIKFKFCIFHNVVIY